MVRVFRGELFSTTEVTEGAELWDLDREGTTKNTKGTKIELRDFFVRFVYFVVDYFSTTEGSEGTESLILNYYFPCFPRIPWFQ